MKRSPDGGVLSAVDSNQFSGLLAAPFTPMHSDGSLHLEVVDRLAQHLISSGVKGAYVCGTTGESLSLTVAERKQVAERWIAAAGMSLEIIVHVGHPCLEDARELARHASSHHAGAIAAMPPSFFRPATIDDLVVYCESLTADTPETPFYYYHIPSMTGVSFSMYDFLQSAVRRVPSLAGIKFTFENLMDFTRCVSYAGGRFRMFFGRDEILLSGLVAGASSAVGSTYNYAAPLYARVVEAYQKGAYNEARHWQSRAAEMVAIISKYGGLSAQKAVMGMIGIDCGPVRLPLRTLSDEQCGALYEALNGIGFFELIPLPVNSRSSFGDTEMLDDLRS